MQASTLRFALTALLSAGLSSPSHAQPDIPEALKPWVGWALHATPGEPTEQCVSIGELRTCIFPSALSLNVDKSGASFELRVALDRRGSVTLPGSTEHFPLDVREANKPLPVLDGAGAPTVHLEAGNHTLSGRFRFAVPPDALQLPSNLAVLTLSVDGARVAFPKRDDSGLLWLRQSGDGNEEERLSLSVHRKLEDGVPLRLTTRVHVSAAGKGREVTLPNALVPGTRPIELRAGLPAELTAQGALRMQVQAGEHDLELVAIRETAAGDFRAPETREPWPERELWVIRTDDRLRHVEVQGPAQIDPARTDLAADWRGLPTYVMPPGQNLKLETRRRGEPEPPPNRLALQRTLWLDLDGDGYTVRDFLSGKLQRGFRLDLLAGELGHAVDSGQDQLITRHEKRAGIELRNRDLRLETEWRLEHGRAKLPAVGYSEHADTLITQLNLPPGFMLLGAEGVDQLHGTWIDSWDLFDFFFVLLVSLAVGKVAGVAYGLVALIALVLTHHEPDAPGVAWVFLLAFTGLMLAIKQGRFAKLLRVGWMFALGCVLLVIIPFSVMQVREALYPHLDESAQDRGPWFLAERAVGALKDEAAPAAPAPQAAAERLLEEAAESDGQAIGADLLESAAGVSVGRGSLGNAGIRGGAGKTADDDGSLAYAERTRSAKLDVDPNAIVQTGPGLPTWQFQQFALKWSGPVQKDQHIQLWIAPPLVTRLWSLASVLFSGLLLFALARAARRAPAGGSSEPPPAASPDVSVAAAALLLTLSGPAAARAQSLPSQELLNELRTRLLEPPACTPECVSVALLELHIDPARLKLRAEVHAAATATYQAPGPLESWAPDQVRVDGKDALAAVRAADGFLHVRLDKGVHQVELSGPVPRNQAFTLALGTHPHYVRAEHNGFLIDGLREDGRAEGSLSLRREVAQSSEAASSQSLVQWFEVRRELELGIRFRVRTSITRLGPANDSALLRVPLLPGENVSEAGLVSDRNGVVIELRRGESVKSFASSLAPVTSLKLSAAQPGAGPLAQPFSEVWVIAPSVLYRPRFEGIAPVAHVADDGRYQPEYRPFPGESVTIHAARLSGAEGASITTDAAQASFTPGSRLERASLRLRIRTSRGATEQLVLPEDTQLTSIAVDGVPRSARIKSGRLELLIDPGAHEIAVELQRPVGIGFQYTPLHLASGRPLTNVTSEVRVPEGRWLLWARGPAWGPAVLFWGYLLVVLLAGALLGRLSLSPLKTHQWCLLGLGLTQVEALVALIIVGWLFALAYREHHAARNRTVFNTTQILLVGLSVLALACLGYAVHRGLVVQPSMQVEGMGSTDQLLRWFADRTPGAFPDVTIWSAPLWIYKALMLLWALWLAGSILHWLRWGFAALRSGGGYRARPRPGNFGSRAAPRASTNPRVALGDVQAAEVELKQNRPEPPPDDGDVGPEGAGVP